MHGRHHRTHADHARRADVPREIPPFLPPQVITKGKAGVAGKIAGSDSVIKTVLFYFYERAWALVKWGKIEGANDAPAPAKPEAAGA